jgi:hypothetical protein
LGRVDEAGCASTPIEELGGCGRVTFHVHHENPARFCVWHELFHVRLAGFPVPWLALAEASSTSCAAPRGHTSHSTAHTRTAQHNMLARTLKLASAMESANHWSAPGVAAAAHMS